MKVLLGSPLLFFIDLSENEDTNVISSHQPPLSESTSTENRKHRASSVTLVEEDSIDDDKDDADSGSDNLKPESSSLAMLLNHKCKLVCPLSENVLIDGYESESPDEVSLVRTACRYGCKLLQRGGDFVIIWLPG